MRIEGLDKLKRRLEKMYKEAKAAQGATVQVGFTQRYAIYVHEDLDAYHKVGQAKYLEAPARRLSGELARIIREAYAKSKNMVKSLLLAGFRLQREAQLLTPVDTSALKASAYTSEESQADQTANAAFQRSENIRATELAKRAKGKKR